MKYEVIGKSFQDVYEKYGDSENIDDIFYQFYQKQNELFEGYYPTDTKVIFHYFRTDNYVVGYTSEINDYIDSLAIKDGLNIVRFENGNIGFVGVYSGYENGFEIMPLSMPIVRNDAIGTMSKEEILDTLSEAINELDGVQLYGTGDSLLNVIIALKEKWGFEE